MVFSLTILRNQILKAALNLLSHAAKQLCQRTFQLLKSIYMISTRSKRSIGSKLEEEGMQIPLIYSNSIHQIALL